MYIYSMIMHQHGGLGDPVTDIITQNPKTSAIGTGVALGLLAALIFGVFK